jgi:hypothetical protein
MASDLYLRTERGGAALVDAHAKLDPWLKHALRLMDGKRDAAAILRTCPPGTGEKLLATLVELGLAQRSVHTPLAASEMTQPMPIVAELPPAPASAAEAVAPVGLRSVARDARSLTGAFRALGPERLQEVKLILANGIMDQAGAPGDDVARRIANAATFLDLAKLIPEAEVLAGRVGSGQLSAFQALVKEQGLPTTAG